MADNIDELHRKIKDLEGEVAYLNAQLKQDNRFGLHWIDVPEAFEAGGENAIPILEEVPDLSITTDDGKPTHILIEGDNYHALTCLNYTHQGKVDVIYIDPPYYAGVYEQALSVLPDCKIVILEHTTNVDFSGYEIIKHKKYGDKTLTYLKKD